MKRIALIRNSYSFDLGGAEKFPINLAEELAGSDFEPVLLSSNMQTLAMAKAANVTRFHSPWWSFQNFSGLRILLFPAYLVWLVFITFWYVFFISKNNIDIVHPQSRDDFIAATIAAKTLGKKIVWTDHADLKHIYMNHKVWYKNPVGKLVYLSGKLADSITLISLSEKKLIEEALGKKIPSNYSVIHIGVVDAYSPKKRDNNIVVIVSTSRLVKDKGIGELIQAFKLIDNKNAELHICGDGPDADYFKSQAADTINITFLGHVDNVAAVLQSSDIFVHPTHHEGFGLSLVEAEMYELPIIASNVGSIPEIVEADRSGFLVESKNPQQLADAMNTLIENPEMRTAMGKAGRKIYLEHFQFDKIVQEKFLPLYEK